MATTLHTDANKRNVQVLMPGQTIVLTFATSSVPTTTAITNSTVVRLIATEDCHVKFGATPIATAEDMFMPANVPEYFELGDVGDSVLVQNIAVIQDSTGGLLYITEML
jgi:hypothetical protein